MLMQNFKSGSDLEISEPQTPEAHLIALADTIDVARDAFLHAFEGGQTQGNAKAVLERILWDDKGTFAPALRQAAEAASLKARIEALEDSEANEIARLQRMASEMRHAIDMIEGAMMGAGELIDIPDKFEDARDDLLLMPKITLGQLRRIVRELSECTRIINSNEYDVAALQSGDAK